MVIARTLLPTALLLSACVAPASRPAGFDNPDMAFLDADRLWSNEDGPLQRITGDFNNDGRADVAYAFLALCGAGSFSTGCDHALYLQNPDRRYIFAGALTPLGEWHGNLEPLSPGSARLRTCITYPDETTRLFPQMITNSGVVDEPPLEVTEETEAALCGMNINQPARTRELCDVATYVATGRCEWRRVD